MPDATCGGVAAMQEENVPSLATTSDPYDKKRHHGSVETLQHGLPTYSESKIVELKKDSRDKNYKNYHHKQNYYEENNNHGEHKHHVRHHPHSHNTHPYAYVSNEDENDMKTSTKDYMFDVRNCKVTWAAFGTAGSILSCMSETVGHEASCVWNRKNYPHPSYDCTDVIKGTRLPQSAERRKGCILNLDTTLGVARFHCAR